VLIVAMWIVLVLAGLALVFARAMRVRLTASANHVAALQAEAAAQGALQVVLSRLDGTDGSYVSDEDVSWEAIPIGGGYAWVLNPSLADDTTYAFGLRDEAARINVNTAPTDVLVQLPGMTSELAAAVVDWRDEDSEISPGGAESEYYLLLSDPYQCKDAPFESPEELLLVKGATPELLTGEDANRNGVLDRNENDAADSEPGDNRDGHLDRGILDFVTVYSAELNRSADGQDRVDVNDVRAQGLSDLIRGAVAEDRFFQLMDRVRDGRPFRNVLDFYFRTGLKQEEFTAIADRISTGGERNLMGLVNVGTAPREVLLCLPGLDESDVDALISRRQSPQTDLTTIAWVAGVLTQEKATAVGSYITASSWQFGADIVAVSADGRSFRRYRAVVDTRTSPARVLCWRDLTAHGWPLDPEILTALRAGKAPLTSTVTGMGGARP
jgi:type II secretory pathway component PulK